MQLLLIIPSFLQILSVSMSLIKSSLSLKILILILKLQKYSESSILNCNYCINSKSNSILSLKIISIQMDLFLFKLSNSSLSSNILIIMTNSIYLKVILISFVSFQIKKTIILFLKMSSTFFSKFLILFLKISKMKILRLIKYKECQIMSLILLNKFSN